ncbi:MAG: hypothetical protein Q9227_006142 [Pyrenula ochraceoflavens]
MVGVSSADTIRILVSTDNHVGFNERDNIRGDDSWKSFHEVMCVAKEQDVDLVLLAGDLFHENKPSRKAMYQVMRSLRMNCWGDKPCELDLLTDNSEIFQGAFNHANYMDENINVAIPVFSIHGNHDDPSGEGHLAALDILHVSGFLNYYGRTPESDNIQIKPVLLQKGRTKLALYGMSNVRDERLHRTFRDNKVKFHTPSAHRDDWFSIMSVHQNHHAYTETGYLPENFLPDFLDLVVWGHEHECLIDPRTNPETNFRVIQPGSSVATSLVPGEAEPKHVSILSIAGKDCSYEKIRLKSVRPFITKEITLYENKEAQRVVRKDNNRTAITRILEREVLELIEQAKDEWLEAQEGPTTEDGEPLEVPLPLVRLRVEISTPEGGKFDCENPVRFSNRFAGKVANTDDVVQYHRRKKGATALKKVSDEVADEAVMATLQGLDTVKVEKLVREFLEAQSLTILPQNSFGDAVSQFIDKDDKHAMEMFVNESLATQIKHLVNLDKDSHDGEDEEADENPLMEAIEKYRAEMEARFDKGHVRKTRGGKKRFKPRPEGWDSDFDGSWEDQPGALLRSDNEVEDGVNGAVQSDGDADTPRAANSSRGRGRGRGRGARGSTTTTRKTAAPARKAASTTSRAKRQTVPDDDSEDNDEDVVMLDHDGESNDESQSMFVTDAAPKRGQASRAKAGLGAGSRGGKASPTKKPPARAAATKARQSKINFTASQASILGDRGSQNRSVSEDIEDSDEDAFEPVRANGKRR